MAQLSARAAVPGRWVGAWGRLAASQQGMHVHAQLAAAARLTRRGCERLRESLRRGLRHCGRDRLCAGGGGAACSSGREGSLISSQRSWMGVR